MTVQAELYFDGPAIEPRDLVRLGRQLDRVRELMRDGHWRTLAQIAAWCSGSEAAVSARLRDLRKTRNGAHLVERRRVVGEEGLWQYRVSNDGQSKERNE